MDVQSTIEGTLGDPLTELTRKERRSLLGVGILGVAIAKTGIVPTKISALGIEFTKTDQQSLLFIIGLVVAYFFFAFVIYAWSDYLRFQRKFCELRQQQQQGRQRADASPGMKALSDEGESKEFRVLTWSKRLIWFRIAFDFFLPAIVGFVAAVLVFIAAAVS